MHDSIFNLHRTKPWCWKERVWLIIIAIAGIIDGLVTLISFGYLETDLRCFVLFEWEELEDWKEGEPFFRVSKGAITNQK